MFGKIYYDFVEPFSQIDMVEFGEHMCLVLFRPHNYQILENPSALLDIILYA